MDPSAASTWNGDGLWTSCRTGPQPRSQHGSAPTLASRSSPETAQRSTLVRAPRVLQTRYRSRIGGTCSTTSARSESPTIRLVRHLTSARARLKALPGTENLPADGSRPRRRSPAEQAVSSAARNRHLARYTEARRLHAEDGLNILQIASALRINRTTVRKYLAADAFPERGRHAVPPSILAPYQTYLNARWSEGARSARGLWGEIQTLGYRGSIRPVSRWAQGRRTEPHACTPRKYLATCMEPSEATRHRGRLPSTRRLAWLLVRDPEALDAAESIVLAHILQDAEVAVLHDLARSYTQMVRGKRADVLEGWLTASSTSGLSALRTFAEGLRRDYAAVRAALEEPWSSGQAEGHRGYSIRATGSRH